MSDQEECDVEISETEVDQFGTMYEVVEEVVCETEDSQDLLLPVDDSEIMHLSEEVLDASGDPMRGVYESIPLSQGILLEEPSQVTQATMSRCKQRRGEKTKPGSLSHFGDQSAILSEAAMVEPAHKPRHWEQKKVQIKTMEGEFSVVMWAAGADDDDTSNPEQDDPDFTEYMTSKKIALDVPVGLDLSDPKQLAELARPGQRLKPKRLTTSPSIVASTPSDTSDRNIGCPHKGCNKMVIIVA